MGFFPPEKQTPFKGEQDNLLTLTVKIKVTTIVKVKQTHPIFVGSQVLNIQ